MNISDIKSSLKISSVDLLIVFATLVASHSFFIFRQRLLAILIFSLLGFLFHFLNKTEQKRFVMLMTIFLGSFWLLEVEYPFFGYLFWPVDQFVGAFLIFIFAKVFNYRREPTNWNFRFSRHMLLSMIGIIFPSLICLIFYFVTHKEIADKWPLPNMPLWAVPFAVILIALINGLREEVYFRFTLQKYLGSAHSLNLAIICSSIVFGYIHYEGGFPAGGWGVLLTTLFGFLVATQFLYFKSATLTWLTHSITDAVMFAIILLNKN